MRTVGCAPGRPGALSPVALTVALSMMVACSSDPPSAAGSSGGGGDAGALSQNEQAKAAFWDALQRNAFSEVEAVWRGLDEAHEAYPDDSETTLLLGLAHLWFTSEGGGDPSIPPVKIGVHANAALGAFELAKQQRPDDVRLFTWVGSTKYFIGRATGNAALMAEGEAVIEEGVAKYPQFNLFAKSLIYAELPKDDPKFQEAVTAVWDILSQCVGETIDKTNPDLTPYLDKQTTEGPLRVCWDGPKMPHNHSGFFLTAGDLIAKAGDAGAASVLYENAKLVEGYATWPHKAVLEERLANLDARVASYQDADPSNDAGLAYSAPKQCAYCHQVQ